MFPLEVSDVRAYLNHLRSIAAKPSSVKALFGLLFHLRRVCGIRDITSDAGLSQTRLAIMEDLQVELYTGSQKAKAMSTKTIRVMVSKVKNLTRFIDRFLIRHVMFLICVVARFADSQHISSEVAQEKRRHRSRGLGYESVWTLQEQRSASPMGT